MITVTEQAINRIQEVSKKKKTGSRKSSELPGIKLTL